MDYKKSIKTYQNTTGALCASGYSKLGTQEAMNDMFVVQSESMAWDGSQISSTLTANNAAGEQHMPDKNNFNAVLNAREGENRMNNNNDYVVRRLTPLECERLQGFPDGWTDIPGASDTARYKALGNSIALPQWQIIIDNMAKYLPGEATLGSLFDGIGGFPLCWERTHGKGTAKWASEIEKFPIEVTQYHFPE